MNRKEREKKKREGGTHSKARSGLFKNRCEKDESTKRGWVMDGTLIRSPAKKAAVGSEKSSCEGERKGDDAELRGKSAGPSKGGLNQSISVGDRESTKEP